MRSSRGLRKWLRLILGSYYSFIGVILQLYWGHITVILGSDYSYIGVRVQLYWG